MWAPFNDSAPSCPNLSCIALASDAAISRLVMPHGTTKSGSPRYRCSKCLKTFTGQERVTRSSRRPGLDVELLNLLMNKMPMRRVCEVAKVNAAVLYNQIERSHSLAVKFAARHERKLINEIALPRVYLAIDRQEYVFNWGSSLDRRNVVLRAIASSDNSSGYVFGMHLDFDAEMEAELTERQAILAGDYELPYHFRKFARVWLQQEHRDYRHTYKRLKSRKQSGSLTQEILQAYKDGLISSEEIEPREDTNVRLPAFGMQVHSEYTLYAHFWFLKKLLQRVEKIRIFMDQDPGMRAACLGAFAPRVKAKTAEAFFVRIQKELTVSKKKTLKSAAERLLRLKMEELKTENRNVAVRHVMEERVAKMTEIGEAGDQWLLHPFPDMSEPAKAVCRITKDGTLELSHLAALYRKASLHSIDKFFMQLRRRISLLERPIQSSNSLRTWHGYSGYNPVVSQRLIELFRIVHNYVLLGDDKKTPAMRIGLATRPYLMEELLRPSMDAGKA
jgi:transposase-like protein